MKQLPLAILRNLTVMLDAGKTEKILRQIEKSAECKYLPIMPSKRQSIGEASRSIEA